MIWPRGRWRLPNRKRRNRRMCRGDGLIGREVRACLRFAVHKGWCWFHWCYMRAAEARLRWFEGTMRDSI